MGKQNRIWAVSFGMILVASMMLLLLQSCSEEQFDPGLIREFSIQSDHSGALYAIKVGLPENYNSSSESYSTIYVLDGEENFDFVANHCREIARRSGAKNVLVVSIGYGNDRSFDYTPTKVSSITGGGAQFLEFIESQLVPAVEQDFRAETTRESRVILGHSYGGLFGACALAVNNDLFGNYILLSPSVWFDNEVALQLENQYRTLNKNTHQLVFLGIGELENSGRMQAPFEAFYQVLRDNYTDLTLGKNREANLTHLASRDPNIIKGLNFYFQNRQSN
jgi:predicted alpha/beta superfamily hydrolase